MALGMNLLRLKLSYIDLIHPKNSQGFNGIAGNFFQFKADPTVNNITEDTYIIICLYKFDL